MRRTWFSARALRLHLTVIVVVSACLALGWWQLSRALGGNGLSWVYTFEWPIFAVYGVYMWWRLVHEAAREAEAEALTAAGGVPAAPVVHAPVSPSVAHLVQELDFDPYDDGADPELAAYNRYLASLHTGQARPGGRPATKARKAADLSAAVSESGTSSPTSPIL